MNKTAIKNFSIWARRKLIDDVEYRAGLVGITKNGIADSLPQSNLFAEFYDIGTQQPYMLSGDGIVQRRKLVEAIRRKEATTDYATAYKYILEEVAYTWFNRLIAIRFMEVNDYLPSHVRVLSSESGKLEPDLVTRPFNAGLSFSEAEEKRILDLQQKSATDELFQMLFFKQCDALNSILPGLFMSINDEFKLLFRASFVDRDGVIYRLTHDIEEKDFRIRTKEDERRLEIGEITEDELPAGQVEIIGWLYQYYNTDPKTEAFAKNGKISKEEIPAVTQLFTPDWIVRYMVENSLGRLVINNLKYDVWSEEEKAKIDVLRAKWKYYIDEAEQTPEVETELRMLEHNKYASGEKLPFVDTTFLDPCMGSGHILVYAFDVFMDIYKVMGWSERDAAQRIIQVNLYGLDIDERARQLAYFSLMMKARQYDRRFFTRNLQPNVFSAKGYPEGEEFGSLITVDELDPAPDYDNWRIGDGDYQIALNRWSFRYVLAQKYDAIVTNPPYMGSDRMPRELKEFVGRDYSDVRYDLYAVCMKRFAELTKAHGYLSMITQHTFLYAYCFASFRKYLLEHSTFINAIHLGPRAFEEISGEVVQTIAFTLMPLSTNCVSSFVSLVDFSSEKEQHFFDEPKVGVYLPDCLAYENYVFAYNMTGKMKRIYLNSVKIGDMFSSKAGVVTGKDDYFLRLWYEVKNNEINFHATGLDNKYVPYSKGGSFVKWYGNIPCVLRLRDLYNDALVNKSVRRGDKNAYFVQCIGWSQMGGGNSKNFSILQSCICGTATPTILSNNVRMTLFALGFLNSKIPEQYIKCFNPLLSTYISDICNLPFVFGSSYDDYIVSVVKENISYARIDWDSCETSWDFKRNPLVAMRMGGANSWGDNPPIKSLEYTFFEWSQICGAHFDKLKSNEEELNRIFIDIYGLQNELTPEVEDKDITVRKADLGRDIRSLISYAVGCMFGRYSFYTDGLLFAGGTWNFDEIYERLNEAAGPTDIEPWSPNALFLPDADNVIPITDEEYLQDDIVSRFCDFILKVYGLETYEENLDFIAKALGNKGDTSREVIRNYFLNDFFNDHCQTYSVTGSGKRPIYWLFDSGKQNGFKALIYLHRYTPDTIGTVRVDYLHRLQYIYECEIGRMQDTIDNSTDKREVAAATKRKEKLTKQLKECRDYDEKLAHLALSRIELDLDDGVKKNYRKLQTAADGKFYEVLAQSKNIMAKE